MGCFEMDSGFLNSAPMRASWCSKGMSSVSLGVVTPTSLDWGFRTTSLREVLREWVRPGEAGGGLTAGDGLMVLTLRWLV